jgi:hypothetical protein
MKLLRQQTRNDWSLPISQVAEELRTLSAAKTSQDAPS